MKRHNIIVALLLLLNAPLVAMQPQIERKKEYDVESTKALQGHLAWLFDQDLSNAEDEEAAQKINSLVSAGADPNVITSTCKSTALHWAARRGFEETIRILLNNGANPNIIGERLKTPLLRLIESPNAYEIRERLVLLLLEHGADPNIADEDKRIPLTEAYIGYLWDRELNIIEYLLVFGADYTVLSQEQRKQLLRKLR